MVRSNSSRCGAAAIAASTSPTCWTRWAATLSGMSSCTACSAARAAGDADHGRQHLVLDDDPGGGILGQVTVLGDHHDDRLADVVDHAVGQRVPGPRGVQRRVRDQHRQRLGGRALQVLVGVDRHHALDVQRLGDVDVADPGVRVRRPDERRLESAGADADVVGVAAVAGDQPQVLDPADGLRRCTG